MKTPPHNLNEITLSQWVGYQNAYGQALDERLTAIAKITDKAERSDAILLHDVDLYQQNYAYFTDTPLDEVLVLDVKDVIAVMGAAFAEHKKQEIKLNYFDVFDWNGAKWKVRPVHNNTGKLTKAEYDMTVDIALIMSDLQDGKHEAMYDLCSTYFRKVGEPYTNDLLEQRGELMMSLPFNMALTVRKFVLESIDKLLKG